MKDDKVCGRDGTSIKGFVAAAVSLTSVFLEMKRMEPVRYAFSFDEEFNCIGVPYPISHLKEHGFMADGCIIEEVTHMTVGTVSLSFASRKAEVVGKVIHSSLVPSKSCNVIEYTALIIPKIR